MRASIARWLLFYPATLLKGEHVARYLRAYRRSERWSRDTLEQWQLSRLRVVVDQALRGSPFHRERLRGVGLQSGSDIRTLADFAALSTMRKQDLIDHMPAIRAQRSLLASVKTTGGSTGEPVSLYKNPQALARERAATWRCYEWAGLEVGASQARLWGVPHTRQGRFKAAATDLFANRKRISAFDLDEDAISVYHEVLKKFRPEFIYGYASALEKYADVIRDSNLPNLPSVRCAISTSEILAPHTRKRIEEGFGVKCFNEYGCGEVGSIAHECEHGSLHLMSENLVVENLGRDDSLVVTDLFNLESPVLRYEIGDHGRISETPCPCGRTLPVLSQVLGRAYDIIATRAGRRVHPEALIYIFEELQRTNRVVRQFQIVQQRNFELVVRIVPGRDWSHEYVKEIESRVEIVLQEPVRCNVVLVEYIEREASGKMRVVKSEMH